VFWGRGSCFGGLNRVPKSERKSTGGRCLNDNESDGWRWSERAQDLDLDWFRLLIAFSPLLVHHRDASVRSFRSFYLLPYF
jgi:hypothetical protein